MQFNLLQFSPAQLLGILFSALGVLILFFYSIFALGILVLIHFFRKRELRNLKGTSITFQMVGASFITALTLFANNSFIYAISVIIIATLITKLEFLEKLMVIFWNRKEYWELEQMKTLVAVQPQTPTENKADEAKLDKIKNNPNETPPDYLLPYHFERTYRLIFGTQLGVLQWLNINKDGVDKSFFESTYQKNPISVSYPFQQYMKFLEDSKLIAFNHLENKYKILPIGEMFLDYLEKNNIPPIRPN